MDTADKDKAVLSYLKKRGFAHAEEALKIDMKKAQDGSVSPAMASSLIDPLQMALLNGSTTETGDLNACYENSYISLAKFVDRSLDCYKMEMVSILYPLFIHIFLDLLTRGSSEDAIRFFTAHQLFHRSLHQEDLTALFILASPIDTSPQSAKQLMCHPTARLYLENRFDLALSRGAHMLLLAQLRDQRWLLKLVNEHIHLCEMGIDNQSLSEPEENLHLLPSLSSEHTDIDAMNSGLVTPSAGNSIFQINSRPVSLGLLREYVDLYNRAVLGLEPSILAVPNANDVSSSSTDPLLVAISLGVLTQNQSPKASDSQPRSMSTLSTKHSISSKIPMYAYDEGLPLSRECPPSIAMYTFSNATDSVNSIVISGDGSFVCAGGADSVVRVWNLMSSHAYELEADEPVTVEASTSATPEVLLSHKPFSTLVGHQGAIFAADFSVDQRYLLTASEDCTVRLWNLDTNRNLMTYKGHNFPVWDVQFSPIGSYFATASNDRTARLWRTDQVQPLRIFAGHISDVECLRFHPNCNLLATGSADTTIRLWDVPSGQCTRVLMGHSGAVSALAFAPNGRTLLSGGMGQDGRVILWDLGTGKKITTFITPPTFTTSALHNRTVTPSESSSTTIDTATAHPNSTVTSLGFSACGTLAASGGLDGWIHCWDVETAAVTHSKRKLLQQSVSVIESSQIENNAWLVSSCRSRCTPIRHLHFTPRNLLLAASVFGAEH